MFLEKKFLITFLVLFLPILPASKALCAGAACGVVEAPTPFMLERRSTRERFICPQCYSAVKTESICKVCRSARTFDTGPVCRAAQEGNEKLLLEVLERGGSVEEQDNLGCRPLHYAAIEDHIDLFGILFLHGAKINTTDKRGATALHYAAHYGSSNAVITLLNLGANALIRRTDNGQTALDSYNSSRSALNGEALEKLRRKTAQGLQTPVATVDLLTAAKNSWSLNVAHLISCGVDVNKTDELTHLTALHYLSQQNTKMAGDIAKMLLKTGANIEFEQAGTKLRPLMMAAMNGCYRTLLILLSAKANVHATDAKGRTALHWAAQHLLSTGHKFSRCTSQKQPNLKHQKKAICYAHLAIKYLLDAGADQTQVDYFGKTAMDYASENSYAQALEMFFCR
jgi:ankyrin repeat protein